MVVTQNILHGCVAVGTEQWKGSFDNHHELCSIYSRAIKGGSGHNDVWRTGAEQGGGAVWHTNKKPNWLRLRFAATHKLLNDWGLTASPGSPVLQNSCLQSPLFCCYEDALKKQVNLWDFQTWPDSFHHELQTDIWSCRTLSMNTVWMQSLSHLFNICAASIYTPGLSWLIIWVFFLVYSDMFILTMHKYHSMSTGANLQQQKAWKNYLNSAFVRKM